MTHPKLDRILAGIQAGMLGGIAMVAAMCVLSVWDLRPWWSYPNLLAVSAYGPRALAMGPGMPSLFGIAFQLAIGGLAGAVFGGVFGNLTGGARVALIGIFWGLVLFFVSERAYGMMTPLIAAHFPRGTLLVAHIIYGAFLSGARRRPELTEPATVVSLPVPVAPADPGIEPDADTPPGPQSGSAGLSGGVQRSPDGALTSLE